MSRGYIETLYDKYRGRMSQCSAAAILTLGLAQISASAARAADYDVGSIHISQPWARATPKGAASAAAYMTVTNNGKTPDRVIACRATPVPSAKFIR